MRVDPDKVSLAADRPATQVNAHDFGRFAALRRGASANDPATLREVARPPHGHRHRREEVRVERDDKIRSIECELQVQGGAEREHGAGLRVLPIEREVTEHPRLRVPAADAVELRRDRGRTIGRQHEPQLATREALEDGAEP